MGTLQAYLIIEERAKRVWERAKQIGDRMWNGRQRVCAQEAEGRGRIREHFELKCRQ